jgi:hypothetical protein
MKMMERCNNKRNHKYPLYGGRGITVCERWRLFENFLNDMGVRPHGRTLDRWPDPYGNYEPTNCRWANAVQQRNNLRNDPYL